MEFRGGRGRKRGAGTRPPREQLVARVPFWPQKREATAVHLSWTLPPAKHLPCARASWETPHMHSKPTMQLWSPAEWVGAAAAVCAGGAACAMGVAPGGPERRKRPRNEDTSKVSPGWKGLCQEHRASTIKRRSLGWMHPLPCTCACGLPGISVEEGREASLEYHDSLLRGRLTTLT